MYEYSFITFIIISIFFCQLHLYHNGDIVAFIRLLGASSLLVALVSPVLKHHPSRQAPPGPHPPGALKGF